MRFNSMEHVEKFIRTGKFPSIHDDIFHAVSEVHEAFECASDLGCCTGLLSQRLISAGIARSVIGVEPNAAYLQHAVRNARITYLNYGLSRATVDDFISRVITNRVELIVARRVFPEISETSGVDFVRELSSLFHRYGVRYIAVEGRKQVQNPKNKLYSIEREIECFENSFETLLTYNNCVILKRKG